MAARSRAPLTRSLILDAIRSAEQVSRVELAQLTGFTEATISTTVRSLLREGLVVEVGHSESTGGKRRTLLGINPHTYFGLGLSLDYDQLNYVVTDVNGATVAHLVTPGTGDTSPPEVMDRIVAEISEFVRDSGIDATRIIGIGVASPGPLDGRAGVLRSSRPTPAWNGYQLRSALSDATGRHVALENDATCAALGEHWINRGPNPHASATIYMADGIGAGLLIDGSVYRGASANAGEIGHITLDIDGPECSCGSRGCLEVLAGPAAVVATARDDAILSQRLALAGVSTRQAFSRLSREAARGDEACIRLLTSSARHLAMAIVTLSNLMDLDEVVLSGPAFASVGALYATTVQQQLAQTAFMREVHPVQVTISQIRSQAAAIGGATLVLQSHVTPHIGRAAQHAGYSPPLAASR